MIKLNNRISLSDSNRSGSAHKQKGAVLAVGLILLLVLSLVGVTNMNKVTTSERLAGNERDMNLAFQAAEAALQEGERKISNLAGTTAPIPETCEGNNCNCQNNNCKTTIWEAENKVVWDDINWDTQSRIMSDDNIPGNNYGKNTLATIPRYVIEFVGIENFSATNPIPLHYYRITSRAGGSTAESEVILQSVYRRAF